MATSTYYYPYQNGGSAAVAGTPPNYNGTQNFTVASQQTSGFIKVVADSTTPNQYQVTFDYNTANPFTETVYQTRYSSTNFNEVTDGYYNYLLSNSALTPNQTYVVNDTGNNGSTQFQPNAAYMADPAACFLAGTRILTANGEIAVEDLAIGDIVVTAKGEERPIKWIGRRSYAGRFAALNSDVLPIRFTRGSLGEALPSRDLWVSPKHAMLIDGMLIPAECLVNNGSIRKDTKVERVDYFHVELDSHDILLAEGAPSESFADEESRALFQNAHEYALLYPDEIETEARFVVPRVESGFEVEAVRHRLASRASLPIAA